MNRFTSTPSRSREGVESEIESFVRLTRMLGDFRFEVALASGAVLLFCVTVVLTGGISADAHGAKRPGSIFGVAAAVVGSDGFVDSLKLGALVVVSAMFVALLLKRPRRWLILGHKKAILRRRLHKAIAGVGVTRVNGARMRRVKIAPAPAGWIINCRLPVGPSFEDLLVARERLAAAISARGVSVTRDVDHGDRITLQVSTADPFAHECSPQRLLDAGRVSCWDAVPMAIDANGSEVGISLPERNLLIGGEPGSGKSSVINVLLASAALDPRVRLHLFDGKKVELAPWKDCAERFVGADVVGAADYLVELVGKMDSVYDDLLRRGLRKVPVGSTLNMIVFDELALFLNTGDRALDTKIERLLRDLVSRGRAAGFVVIAATQRPSSDVISTSIRDLFSLRWAMRCTTSASSDIVLGHGYATAGYDASSIYLASRGVGILLGEGMTPTLCRAQYLSDDGVAQVVRRAIALRASYAAHPSGTGRDGSRDV